MAENRGPFCYTCATPDGKRLQMIEVEPDTFECPACSTGAVRAAPMEAGTKLEPGESIVDAAKRSNIIELGTTEYATNYTQNVPPSLQKHVDEAVDRFMEELTIAGAREQVLGFTRGMALAAYCWKYPPRASDD